MLLHVPDVLTKAQLADLRRLIDTAPWSDGNATSGHQSALAKKNLQIPEADPIGQAASRIIAEAVARNPLFISAALPHTVFPPLFSRYVGGEAFAMHVDNGVRQSGDGRVRIRTDLSATLFLAEPEEYEGGELVVEDTYGAHEVKLPAGDLILYPSSSLHEVRPVTEGRREVSFFWIQSLVREDARRALLFDMDLAIQRLAQSVGQGDAGIVALTGGYHNLLRMWAEL
ncbi:Fe2+-dependent dioxygenase [Phenylobacterium immobile]|uniref:Fe2+-dependent dioxygenase n=1 Tax=Phenylobacterium immobile TaxID=21 RepID=UPI000AA1193A|nr:Fe2+-dependent dioxygenase [Phenylobacterium immobile]